LRVLCIAAAVLDGAFAATGDAANVRISPEGHMDLVVVAVVIALAAVAYVWLALVERA
jgi:hypothetical protein